MALVVITGGARSGKSAAAQRLALARSQAHECGVAVAVFGRECDAEMGERIAAHRENRPESFLTLEVDEPDRWLDDVDPEALLVIDCLGTLLGLVMERAWDAVDGGCGGLAEASASSLPEGFAEQVQEGFSALLERIASRSGDTIVVTNEVGQAPVAQWASGRLFTDLLGMGNRRLVADASAAYCYVAGRAVDLLALPSAAAWPED